MPRCTADTIDDVLRAFSVGGFNILNGDCTEVMGQYYRPRAFIEFLWHHNCFRTLKLLKLELMLEAEDRRLTPRRAYYLLWVSLLLDDPLVWGSDGSRLAIKFIPLAGQLRIQNNFSFDPNHSPLDIWRHEEHCFRRLPYLFQKYLAVAIRKLGLPDEAADEAVYWKTVAEDMERTIGPKDWVFYGTKRR